MVRKTEGKGKYRKYNRNHKYDNGAVQAYSCGERPISYWTKKAIVSSIHSTMEESKATLTPYFNKNNILYLSAIQKIKSMKKAELVKYALRKTSLHQTGNYYKNTWFYRVVEADELPDLFNKLIVHADVRQLNISLMQ